MEQLLHRTADESTYYIPPLGIWLLRTTTNWYFSAAFLKGLHQRVCIGLFTMCIKSEPIGVSFSTKRQTNGPTQVETMSTMYNGMGLAHILPCHGLRKESNTDAPWIWPFRPDGTWRWLNCNSLSTRTILQNSLIEKIIVEVFWGSTGKTKPSQTGLKGTFCKALVTHSHAPSFWNSGVFGERRVQAL